MTLVILSPHRDDAAFSCGIAMRLALKAGLPVRILNVFTRSGYAPFANETDLAAITNLRLREDLRVAQALGKKLVLEDLGWADAPVRRAIAPEQTFGQTLDAALFDREATALAAALQPKLKDAACVLIPLANQHLDHKIARAAAEQSVPAERLAYYEDLPYFARLSPAEREASLRALVPPSTRRLAAFHPAGAAIKRELAACYPSQVDPATMEEIAHYASQQAEQTHPDLYPSNVLAGAEVLYAGGEAEAVLGSLLAEVERL